MLKIQMHAKVIHFIGNLPAKQFKQVMLAVLNLSKEPIANDVITLTGYQGIKRKDVGEYRIIFEHDEINLFTWVIGKRNDDEVYKSFKQLKS